LYKKENPRPKGRGLPALVPKTTVRGINAVFLLDTAKQIPVDRGDDAVDLR
jgi:hypothetical protein